MIMLEESAGTDMQGIVRAADGSGENPCFQGMVVIA